MSTVVLLPLLLFSPQEFSGRVVLDEAEQVFGGFQLTADGREVLYRRRVGPGVKELFIVPVDGSAAPMQLSANGGGDVRPTLVLAGTRVLYQADEDVAGRYELFSVPLDGSAAPVKLNGAIVAGGSLSGVVLVDAAAERAVYVADADSDDEFELFSVPVDGSAGPTKLNPPLPAGGDVLEARLTPSGSHVVYTAEQNTAGVVELFSVPIEGGTSVTVNDALVTGGDVERFEVAESAIVYLADQAIDGVPELFSAPAPGGPGPVRRLNPALGAGDAILEFAIAPDGQRVGLAERRAGKESIHTAGVRGFSFGVVESDLGGHLVDFGFSPDSQKLLWNDDVGISVLLQAGPNAAGTTGAEMATLDGFDWGTGVPFAFGRGGQTVVYRNDGGLPIPLELASRPIDASAPPIVLNTITGAGESALAMQPASVGNAVVYLATDVALGNDRLYRAPIDGGAVRELLSPELVPPANVIGFRVTPDARTVVYRADPLGATKAGLYSVARLELAAVEPPFGPNNGGQTVLITGHGFTESTEVRFDGVPSPQVDRIDGGTLLAVVPAAAWMPGGRRRALVARWVDVEVVDAGAVVRVTRAYLYLRP